MHIFFTDEEQKYIIKDIFEWKVKKDCPQDVKKEILKKMSAFEIQKDIVYGKI
jgi:hypothetical protein